ncbi:MAG: peptide-methionine (S)-S-oxide reductase MsrA [Alphaproteobacteria bacterium]|jgi:peptide-methionine (S)-S-oxide reductase|tara:strand:+ start:44720 stop:45172 length:453 start_codon:yes stop_codon:yes gene_type:complete
MEKILFGAGCFWHVEKIFFNTKGVSATSVGYAGGQSENPTYKEVCYGLTGHAEVVKVEFNEDDISVEKLLNVFWEIHDPTQVNRQGPDIGSQYRSCIFSVNENHLNIIRNIIINIENTKRYQLPIATILYEEENFWLAEEYHQKYLIKNY